MSYNLSLKHHREETNLNVFVTTPGLSILAFPVSPSNVAVSEAEAAHFVQNMGICNPFWFQKITPHLSSLLVNHV